MIAVDFSPRTTRLTRPRVASATLESALLARYGFAMANTFTSLHYHVIFSTKSREPWIRPEIEQRVWAYLGGTARENRMKALLVGGIENHVHLLLGVPPVLAVSKAVQLLKAVPPDG